MELSPIQWGLIGFVIIVIALLLAHRYFLPFSLLPKEDPLDQRIAHDLPEVSGPDDAVITEVMRTGQPVERTIPHYGQRDRKNQQTDSIAKLVASVQADRRAQELARSNEETEFQFNHTFRPRR